MSRPLIRLLLLVKTTLLLHLRNCRIHFLRLLFGSKCSLLGGGSSIIAVLAPVSKVARTSHIVLRETKDLQGLDEKLFLRERIADEVMIIGGMLIREEV